MPRFRPHKMYPGALLAQEVCSYQAMTQLLMGMDGRLAVVIHSDRDCSSVIPKTGRGLQLHPDWDRRFFCTNLKEHEIVAGLGNQKLRKAIELVKQGVDPDLMVVLSTCPTVMIGDNMKNVARKAGRDLDANVVAQVTHGLRPKSPAEVIDDCYSMLARGAKRTLPEPDLERRLNLVGIKMNRVELAEIREVLGALRLEVNAVLSEGSHLDDFLRVPDARWNVHPGPHMMLKFDEGCTEQFAMRTIEVPLPIGLSATDRFYRAIATGVGDADADVDTVLTPRRGAAAAAMQAFRDGPMAEVERARGRRPRLGYNAGSVRSFDLRRVALEELGDLPLFEELGFEVHLFIQGPSDANNLERTAGVLAELGCRHPFTLFRDPGSLAKILKPGELDLFFGADFLREQLARVNLPLLELDALLMGYDGVADNLDRIGGCLSSRFYGYFAAETSDAVAPDDVSTGLARAPATRHV